MKRSLFDSLLQLLFCTQLAEVLGQELFPANGNFAALSMTEVNDNG